MSSRIRQRQLWTTAGLMLDNGRLLEGRDSAFVMLVSLVLACFLTQ